MRLAEETRATEARLAAERAAEEEKAAKASAAEKLRLEEVEHLAAEDRLTEEQRDTEARLAAEETAEEERPQEGPTAEEGHSAGPEASFASASPPRALGITLLEGDGNGGLVGQDPGPSRGPAAKPVEQGPPTWRL